MSTVYMYVEDFRVYFSIVYWYVSHSQKDNFFFPCFRKTKVQGSLLKTFLLFTLQLLNGFNGSFSVCWFLPWLAILTIKSATFL